MVFFSLLYEVWCFCWVDFVDCFNNDDDDGFAVPDCDNDYEHKICLMTKSRFVYCELSVLCVIAIVYVSCMLMFAATWSAIGK